MLCNLFWLAVCVLLVCASLRVVRWSSSFPASPTPQQKQDTPACAAPRHRRRRQDQSADDSAFTRAA